MTMIGTPLKMPTTLKILVVKRDLTATTGKHYTWGFPPPLS